MRTRPDEPTPEGYARHPITAVINHGDCLTIKYAGKQFSGVMLAELPPGILDHIQPGTDLIIRLHSAETGYAGTVAHMLIPHPDQDGWAEIYEDF